MEIILTLLAFKCLYPEHVHLSRGNHESKHMNQVYGFEGEVRENRVCYGRQVPEEMLWNNADPMQS